MQQVMSASVGAMAVAFVGGVVSFFSPCVAPLVPGYIGYLAGTTLRAPTSVPAAAAARVAGAGVAGAGVAGAGVAGASGGATVAEAALPAAPVRWRSNPALPVCLLFVAGFSLAFVALGLLSASFGRLLIAYRPVLETLAGIVMLGMGAFLLNLLPRGVTTALLREQRLALGSGAVRRLQGAAPFALGIVFAAGWTPCIGPVLAAILLYAGASADRGLGALLMSAYALGFALPFVAVGLGWSTSLRTLGWMRRHGHLISLATGVALVLVGILYLTGQVAIFSVWAQQIGTPALP